MTDITTPHPSPIADEVIAILDRFPGSELRQQVEQLGIYGVMRSQFVYSALRAIESRVSGNAELREVWFGVSAARVRLEDEMREQYVAMGLPEMIERMDLSKEASR